MSKASVNYLAPSQLSLLELKLRVKIKCLKKLHVSLLEGVLSLQVNSNIAPAFLFFFYLSALNP